MHKTLCSTFVSWPLNSSDLNLVDCQIYGMMQDCMCQMPVQDVTALRVHLIDTWSSLSQSITDSTIDKWQKRLQACVNEKRRTFWTLAV